MWRIACILILCLLSSMAWATTPWYQVEVLVYVHLSDKGLNSEQWPLTVNDVFVTIFISLNIIYIFFFQHDNLYFVLKKAYNVCFCKNIFNIDYKNKSAKWKVPSAKQKCQAKFYLALVNSLNVRHTAWMATYTGKYIHMSRKCVENENMYKGHKFQILSWFAST